MFILSWSYELYTQSYDSASVMVSYRPIVLFFFFFFFLSKFKVNVKVLILDKHISRNRIINKKSSKILYEDICFTSPATLFDNQTSLLIFLDVYTPGTVSSPSVYRYDTILTRWQFGLNDWKVPLLYIIYFSFFHTKLFHTVQCE